MFQELSLTTIQEILDYNKLMKAHLIMWSNQGRCLVGFSENELAPFVIKTVNKDTSFMPMDTISFVVKNNDLTKIAKAMKEDPGNSKLIMNINEIHYPNLYTRELLLYKDGKPADLIPAFDFHRFNDIYFNAWEDWSMSHKVLEFPDIIKVPELEPVITSKSSDGIIRVAVDGRVFAVPQPFLNTLKKDTVSLQLLQNFNRPNTYIGRFIIYKPKGIVENMYFRSVKLDNL